jgi:hypothetical protein
VPLAEDRTFTLERDERAWDEDASVRPNRRAGTMTWRAEIRTPGLPPDTRRLGDLRLECEVGIESRLISNRRPSLFSWLDEALTSGPRYCHQSAPRYLFFADRPLFGVSLVAGDRKESIPVDRLYAGASRDPDWKDDLPYCDCEVLVDRTYFLPLGDLSWPDDTLVRFDYMDDVPPPDPDTVCSANDVCTKVEPSAPRNEPPAPRNEPPAPRNEPPARKPAAPEALQPGEVRSVGAAASAIAPGRSTRAEVRSVLGEAVVIDFESGYEVWVYKEPLRDESAPPAPDAVLNRRSDGALPRELVLLFVPSGVVGRTRIR